MKRTLYVIIALIAISSWSYSTHAAVAYTPDSLNYNHDVNGDGKLEQDNNRNDIADNAEVVTPDPGATGGGTVEEPADTEEPQDADQPTAAQEPPDSVIDECVDTTGVDSDEDGIMDGCDNCIYIPNADQIDMDDDGTGDLCNGDRYAQPEIAEGSKSPQPSIGIPSGARVLAADGGACTMVESAQIPYGAMNIISIAVAFVSLIFIRRGK